MQLTLMQVLTGLFEFVFSDTITVPIQDVEKVERISMSVETRLQDLNDSVLN
jgi:hypothetical protein